MLAVYDIAHSLPLGDVGRDFPFTKDETRSHFSYLAGNFQFNYEVKASYVKRDVF